MDRTVQFGSTFKILVEVQPVGTCTIAHEYPFRLGAEVHDRKGKSSSL
jgi:hypothetical protein